MPMVIDRLSCKYPRVAFHITTADPVVLIEHGLRQRNIELATGPMPEAAISGEDIQSEILFDERHVVMAGLQSKWARRRNIALADLIDEPWILPPPESIMGFEIAQAFRAHGLEPPRSRIVSFSIPFCHYLLATGRYLSMQPLLMARLGKHLPLRLLNVRFTAVPRPITIMTLKNRTLSPLAQLFISCAREVAKPLMKASISRQPSVSRT